MALRLADSVELLEQEKIRLRRLSREIRDYESYSWNNDRQFINSRIEGA